MNGLRRVVGVFAVLATGGTLCFGQDSKGLPGNAKLLSPVEASPLPAAIPLQPSDSLATPYDFASDQGTESTFVLPPVLFVSYEPRYLQHAPVMFGDFLGGRYFRGGYSLGRLSARYLDSGLDNLYPTVNLP